MHVYDEQRVDLLAGDLVQLVPHHGHQVVQLAGQFGLQVLHGVLVAVLGLPKRVLHLPCPPDLAAHQPHHTQHHLEPLRAVVLGINKHPLLGDIPQTNMHLLLTRGHPALHGAVDIRDRAEGEPLRLRGRHSLDHLVVAREVHALDVIEQLQQVDLDGGGVGVAQYGEQLVVGDEEEPGEGGALGVQVVREGLLAAVQPF
mmetsp:Transcript_27782/g.62232  ORF Transcript_27782/g.62232 Transcript_27782/m.62232 type:complete len:200 (+) Transcript_27782:2045-2644(+)